MSRETRQLKKKLIQEISFLCQLEQVNPDQLLKVSEGRRQLWRARAASILGKLYRERGLQGLRPHPAVRVCRAGTPLSELSYRYPTPSRSCFFSMRPDTLRVRRAEGHILNLVPFVFSARYDLWYVTRSSSSGAFLCTLGCFNREQIYTTETVD